MDQGSREIIYEKNLILRKPIPLLQKAMIFYIAIWSISPPLEIDSIFRMAALVCAVGWFVLDMIRGLRLRQMHLFGLLFVFLVVLVSIIETNGELSKLLKQISTYLLVMAFIMNYSYRDRWDELKMLVPVMLVLLFVFNILTTRELIIDPTLSRRIVRADEEMYTYMRRGVGGYELVYSQVLLFPAILSWTISALKGKKLWFAFGIAWIVSYITLILNAGYSIALVTTISATFVLFFGKNKSILPSLIITLSFIVIIVLLIGYVDPVRLYLMESFEGTKVARKVEDIYNSLHGTIVADSIMERWIRYKTSMRAILEYPGIGGLWFGEIGGHSAILDSFAKYGVFGGIMFLKMYFHAPGKLKQNASNKKELRVANSILIAFILVTLLDTVPYNMVFPAMILLPILLNDISNWGGFDESPLDGKYSPRRFVRKIIDKIRKFRRMDRSDGSGPWQPSGHRTIDRM